MRFSKRLAKNCSIKQDSHFLYVSLNETKRQVNTHDPPFGFWLILCYFTVTFVFISFFVPSFNTTVISITAAPCFFPVAFPFLVMVTTDFFVERYVILATFALSSFLLSEMAASCHWSSCKSKFLSATVPTGFQFLWCGPSDFSYASPQNRLCNKNGYVWLYSLYNHT